MPLQTPNLDDRKFQDIVSEARSKIPQYCPDWTDYNLSDPGITLIELFAWMTDMLLYRINRVPEKNYIKFMELIGVRLQAPRPAQVEVSLRLSAPQPHAITIPKGTEVATVRTETQEAVSFTTNEDLVIVVPELAYAFTSADGKAFIDCMPSLRRQDKRVSVFKQLPEEDNAIYFGFSTALSSQTLFLTIDSSIEGIGVDPSDPPLAWEFWDAQRDRWGVLRVEGDTTGGLNTRGTVTLFIPRGVAVTDLNSQRAFWVRCRATRPRAGQQPYTSSPQIRSVTADCIGGTVSASHCLRMAGELLGRGSGTPGQTLLLNNRPVLPREAGETVEIETEREGEFEAWREVTDFSESGPDDSHFTLDSVSGEVQFGPLIRQPSGEVRQYGRVPALGRRIRFSGYRWGGGVAGNVGANTIRTLKSSLPFVASVTNFTHSVGGTDAETLEAAAIRAPKILRNQTRAVTADDFEYLALQASPHVVRAKCFASGMAANAQAIPPGVVRLLLVPKVTDPEGPISRNELELLGSVKSEVQEYLDERRLLAMRVEIAEPDYQMVAVEAQVRVRMGVDFDQVTANVQRKLYQYINPVCGGPKGQGWPFGRSLFQSEVYSVIQSAPGVDYVESAQLLLVDRETGQRRAVDARISIPVNGLLCSGEHHVTAALVESD